MNPQNKLTTEQFISKAKEVHGGKFDYSKTKYINNATKVCITCPIHGEFWQVASTHINLKCGCPLCANKGSGKRNSSREQEISEISRSLKILAKELDIPVIALSQLSRGVEKRDDKRPMLSDLRESGAIEQDADIVMFLYRDDYYNDDSEKKNVAEVILAKHRGGATGTVDLAWLPSYTKFANLEKRFFEGA